MTLHDWWIHLSVSRCALVMALPLAGALIGWYIAAVRRRQNGAVFVRQAPARAAERSVYREMS